MGNKEGGISLEDKHWQWIDEQVASSGLKGRSDFLRAFFSEVMDGLWKKGIDKNAKEGTDDWYLVNYNDADFDRLKKIKEIRLKELQIQLAGKKLEEPPKAFSTVKDFERESAKPKFKPAAILEFSVKCSQCDQIWDSLYFDDRDNPLQAMHHALAAHLNLQHQMQTVPPEMSPYRFNEKKRQEMLGA